LAESRGKGGDGQGDLTRMKRMEGDEEDKKKRNLIFLSCISSSILFILVE
jgi:hypothetical protein